ncbi:MAG: ammonium transporter [Spirochaetota bacterium]
MINQADTVWMLIATAMVMIMTPTLAFFYGGLVRKKNILSVLMQCMVMLCIISVQWVLFGYSLAFGPDKNGLIGGLEWLGLNNVGLIPNNDYFNTIPHLLFMGFQMMFAVITPALMIGAFVERIKFKGFLVFSVLWATLIYDPLAHWIWAKGGWLCQMGALDFAGGTVIHLSAGVAALVFILLMGKRSGNNANRSPHNLPFAVLGTGFLWFGWFGFNAGSAGAANSVAVAAFINTNTAAAAGGLLWMILDWKMNQVPTMLGLATGIVAGLAAVTPGAGYVTPLSALLIGCMSSIICFFFVSRIKKYFGYDDALDVFGVHGIAGILGTLAVGLFATKTVNPGGADGLFYGNAHQLAIQSLMVAVAIVFVAIGTTIIYKLVDILIGMRVGNDDEYIGLDLTQHHEAGYTLVD